MSVTQPDGYWKFDESSGDAADSTSGANTLTNNGSATYGAGALNNGVDLTTTGKYMSHADAAVFDATTGFSISCWIYLNAAPGAAEWAIISKSGAAGNFAWTVELGVFPNGIYVIGSLNGTYDSGQYNEWDSAASILPATGAWHHYVVTLNPSTGVCTAYIDNVAKTMTIRQAHVTTSLFNGNGTFEWGAAYNGGSRTGNWKMDECGYWKNYILTSTEVGELYNSGTPPTYDSLWGGATAFPRKALLGVGK